MITTGTNSERSLAHIEKVKEIIPIPGADNIEKIIVLGWELIARKGEFKEGDPCLYIEIDSKVPSNDPRFAFLSKKGFKIKTLKLNRFGIISQGLALPLQEFPEFDKIKYKTGTDVTKQLGITKILDLEEIKQQKIEKFNRERIKEIKFNIACKKHPKFFSSKLGKKIKKSNFWRNVFGFLFGGKVKQPKKFPSYIVKTDEERCENLPWVTTYKNALVATEKIEGTSTTFAIRFKNKKKKKYEISVCSRNVRQADIYQKCMFEKNVYWDMYNKYKVEEALKDIAKKYNADIVIIQGETYGPDIQGNIYELEEVQFLAYNLILGYTEGSKEFELALKDSLGKYKRVGDCMQTRIDTITAKGILEKYNIPWVPILDRNYIIPDTMELLKQAATAKSVINPKVLREGVVYRSESDPMFSFKNVSNEYLLQYRK